MRGTRRGRCRRCGGSRGGRGACRRSRCACRCRRTQTSLLGGELTVADREVDRIGVGAEGADNHLDEFFAEALVEIVADGGKDDGGFRDAVARAGGGDADGFGDVDAFEEVVAFDALAVPEVMIGFITDLVQVHDATHTWRVHGGAADKVDPGGGGVPVGEQRGDGIGLGGVEDGDVDAVLDHLVGQLTGGGGTVAFGGGDAGGDFLRERTSRVLPPRLELGETKVLWANCWRSRRTPDSVE